MWASFGLGKGSVRTESANVAVGQNVRSGSNGPFLYIDGREVETVVDIDTDVAVNDGTLIVEILQESTSKLLGTSTPTHVSRPRLPSQVSEVKPAREASEQLDQLPRYPKLNQLPEWLVGKVDDYITAHFYTLEAKVEQIEANLGETAQKMQSQQTKVEELLHHVKTLVEISHKEYKKGVGRDEESLQVAEEIGKLKQEVAIISRQQQEFLVTMRQDIKAQVRIDTSKSQEGHIVTYSEYSENLDKGIASRHWASLPKKLDFDIKDCVNESMEKVQDCIFNVESQLSSVKQSVTSLRMEYKKFTKAQDFKNTTTSVFLLKAIDTKPDERKQMLSKLSEHEDKCRSAVQRADDTLRTKHGDVQDDEA